MDISIIIVNWNTRELLRKCLESVEATVRPFSREIIIVDNASVDSSVAMLRECFPDIRLIENIENRGFGAANNQALRVMTGRYALLLNSDAVLTDNAVYELYSFMESRPDAAMACGQLLNADGSRQNSIAAFPSLLTLMTNVPLLEYLFPKHFPSKRYNYPGPVEVDSGIGACLMVRKAAIDAVGMFDERYFFFFEETDWAYRMRRGGWKIVHLPQAHIYHFQGQSAKMNPRSRIEFYHSRYQFLKKWRSPFQYALAAMVIVVRLVINWSLTAAAAIITAGLHRGLRSKLIEYSAVIHWHLQGCPERKMR